MEAALVFDITGVPIHWHVPPDRSMAAIPDSADLWEILWDNKIILRGVAHTHPWSGSAAPSSTDVTTFAAVEAGLGKRLVWPVVTFSEVRYFVWQGPDRLNYGEMERRRFRLHRDDIEHLRDLSR
jgi:hypothetical protein